MSFILTRGIAIFLTTMSAHAAFAADAIPLVEKFSPDDPYRVELKVNLTGRLALQRGKDKSPDVLPMQGVGSLVYDEKVLPELEGHTARAIRIYRDVEFKRTLGDKNQEADIRATVRRMVVLRSEKGKKVPFSPDGPLNWGEIDVVRTDIFSLALIPGLLPAKPVVPGNKWDASRTAIAELTDYDPIEEGSLTVEFVSVVTVKDRRYAKLALDGEVKGRTEDGPSRQKLTGTAFFDLEAQRLTYLNLKGAHQLLGPDGKTTGKIDGTFVMTRGPALKKDELGDAALRGIELKPTPENSLLTYDNPDLGVKFTYPRRWRVGTVQGNQLTIEESTGGGILLTMESAVSTPTPEQYAAESRKYLSSRKWIVENVEEVRRTSEKPVRVDRFAIDAEVDKERVRMEYAVIATADGGATLAARLPWAERKELRDDLETILKSIAVTKKIAK